MIGRYVKPGDRISVRGLKPRHVQVLAAVLLITSSGPQILVEGPDRGTHERKQPTGRETEIDVVEGMQFDRGYVNPTSSTIRTSRRRIWTTP